MKKLTGHQIRQMWIEFFESKGHHFEEGVSLIPKNDPTLLWINSGVAGLKRYFDGSLIPHSRRIVNVQKCLRTNDMEEVGLTARHQTFFEMLGCFSIGDYFRNEIIPWAFEILTSERWFAFEKDKLYFTYHPSDVETHALWLKQGVDESHLIPLESNYWQIGEGPCGPNTEVFYDRGEKYDKMHRGDELLRKDLENDRYIEIWGIVFSQFNAVNGVDRKDYKELPAKNIDTGAGLERIACVMQEVETNFDTDLFMPMIRATEKIAKVPYKENPMPYRVIADHIRACTFALSDGESFSNEGRGYVLRRLLRRAMVYARHIGIDKPFLHLLVPAVVLNMHDFYPYLDTKMEVVQKMMKAEEEKFLKTLANGEHMLKKMVQNDEKLSGQDAFKLYDTFGFPLELTRELCDYMGVSIDEAGFEVEMEKQKERARSARKVVESMSKQSGDLMKFTSPSTFDYDAFSLKGTIIALFKDGEQVSSLDDEGDVIFDKTCFYAESGGQVSDVGEIANETTHAKVSYVYHAPNGQNLHHVHVQFGLLQVGDKFDLRIDRKQRILTMRNHSATHLLQKALIDVLGDHIKQEGSFVSKDYLRFDFSHPSKISSSDLKEIENRVNEWISEGIEEKTLVLPIEEAKKIGARAFFDEKYGDIVRVVTFGDVSKEFCGGTHVKNSEDIGIFKIVSEESIASGIRRIEAVTSLGALSYIDQEENVIDRAKTSLNAKSKFEVNDRLNATLSNLDNVKKHALYLESEIAKVMADVLKQEMGTYLSYNLLLRYLPKVTRNGLLPLYDELKNGDDKHLIVLVGKDENSYPFLVGVGDKVVSDGIEAKNIIDILKKYLPGSGGGRAKLAQGSFKNVDQIEVAFASLKKELK